MRRKPSKDDDGNNIKKKVSNSQLKPKRSKTKKEKSGRALGSTKDKEKKKEKTTKNQPVTKNKNMTVKKRNNLSAGHSTDPGTV